MADGIGMRCLSVLDGQWMLARSEPGACVDAGEIKHHSLTWMPATVPATVAQILGADFDTVGRYDANDWWYRCQFDDLDTIPSQRLRLRFDGLATLAEVWLNGEPLLTSRNMFMQHSVEVTGRIAAQNELVICLRSLDRELAQRKPRPRWKTALVEQQNLRWVRTTLLGRMPGWTPPIQPVGIWKPVWLERVSTVDIHALDLQTRAIGTQGCINLRSSFSIPDGRPLQQARLRIGEQTYALTVEPGANYTICADVTIDEIPLWWPHTHGTPTLLPCRLEFEIGDDWIDINCGRIGFKDLALNREGGQVQFMVNGIPVFCRGACWTTDDFMALHGDPLQLRRTLTLARDSGLNMLRVGGTMTYESDAFYALCDELGIMVWQDFMFANMDYPISDDAFSADIEREAVQHLGRFQRHVCIATYCGGSEIEQQAAMMGLPSQDWSNAFFAEKLPALCSRQHAGIPYFRSSPCEGALPFHVSDGIAHYYGVGAYRRPMSDVRHANVKFAAECLGFANVPEASTVALLAGGTLPPAHHPRWKLRQPRDNGAGWDFEDVRDHYLQQLLGLDPISLRGQDTERYYAISRVVSGEVMRQVFAEWRAPGSHCGGGLVWFLKDLWPGAGWGIIDSTGTPKAAYWYLKRIWASRTVFITDHGLDGLRLHVLNEHAQALRGTIFFAQYQHGRIRVAAAEQPFSLPANGALSLAADALLDRFTDTAYAYRFGPPQHDVTVARLVADDGTVLAEDFHFPQGLNFPQQAKPQWAVSANRRSDGCVLVDFASDTFVQAVHFECDGFVPDDAYFHLAPQSCKQVVFRPLDPAPRKFKAYVGALNIQETVIIRVD